MHGAASAKQCHKHVRLSTPGTMLACFALWITLQPNPDKQDVYMCINAFHLALGGLTLDEIPVDNTASWS